LYYAGGAQKIEYRLLISYVQLLACFDWEAHQVYWKKTRKRWI